MPVPIRVPWVDRASAAWDFTFGMCARLPDGTVRCNGAVSGFDRNTFTFGPPRDVLALRGAVEMDGAFGQCAVMADGTVLSAGENSYGQLGLGSNLPPPAGWHLIPALNDVVHLRRSQWSTCAVRRDGSLWCWGADVFDGIDPSVPGSAACDGENWTTTTPTRGDRSRVWCQLSPRRVEGLPGPVVDVAFTTASPIEARPVAVCALLRDGTVWCWGVNNEAQVGDGRDPSDEICTAPGSAPGTSPTRWLCRRRPRQAAHVYATRLLTGGSAGFLVVREDDTIWRWGRGNPTPGPTQSSLTQVPWETAETAP